MGVQVFGVTPKASQAGALGQALSQGLSKNLPAPELMVQRGMLEQAFKNLDPNSSYEEQLQSIVPTLMTTQGGAEALQTLAPILQQRARNRAVSQAVKSKLGQNEQQDQRAPGVNVGVPTQGEGGQPIGVAPGQVAPGEDQDKFRDPSVPGSEEPIYPQMTAGPEAMDLMSPPEMEQYALKLMDTSGQTGSPMSFQEAMQLAQTDQNNRENYNQRISKETEDRLQNIKDLNADVVERAINSGLIQSDDDESRTIAEKLGFQARDAKNPAERWEYVRTGLRAFNNAREGIRREGRIPGRFGIIGRKLLGTYKDKQTVQKDLQDFVTPYLKYGMYDELRTELTTQLGMGPEDAEMTIFPFSKEESASLNKFDKNSKVPGITQFGSKSPYPGEAFNIQDENKFDKLKNDVEGYLKKFPKANLVTLRGRLNQDKKYSWQDISRSIGELVEEKRFTPDNYQYSQLPIIKQAPLPGMTEQFKDWWQLTR